MRIQEHFIKNNNRIEIISNNGEPISFPETWEQVLGDCDVLVAIPDMHMYIHDAMIDNFQYGAESLIHLLKHIKDVKNALEGEDKLLRVFQLGDMYELRFPGKRGNCTVDEIKASHNDYSIILDLFDSSYVNRIYGNHDFENRHFQGYQLNYLQGKIYLEHGFAADSWQANPAAGLLWEISSIGLLAYRDLNEFFNKIEIEAGDLQKDRVFSWSVTSGKNPRKDMTPETDYLKDNGDIKNYYCNRLINRKNSNDCKISIIGHTHHPYIDKNVQNGNFMYIDAGGWTEGRSDFVVATDEEIAICHYKRDSEII